MALSDLLFSALKSGAITAPAARVFGLEEPAQAHDFLESRASTGAAILAPEKP